MKWMTRLTILAVFVLGVVAGAMLGMKHERDRFLKMQRNGPASLTDQALKRISSEVKLRPDQEDKMRAVLTKAQPALAAAEDERRRKVLVIMESVRDSAVAFLDAGQRKLYDVLHDRLKLKLSPGGVSLSGLAGMLGG
jgi:hypothetical protein